MPSKPVQMPIVAPANFSVDILLVSDIPITSDGFTVLGSLLDPAEYRLETILGRIQKMKYSLHRLGDLEDSQMETALLRSCFSLPKFTHLLRTCPPDIIQSALVKFDEIMRDVVSDLAGCPLSDWSWLKSSLPSSLGGLNIRHATLYAPTNFIVSLHQSESLVSDILGHPVKAPLHLPYAINALAKSVARPDWISIESIDVPLRGHSLSHSIDDACFSFLVESSPDVRSKALALSSALPHARDWLNVVPCSALGLHLMDCEFCLCLKYWLGLQMFEDGARCPVSHVVANPFGDHQVGCGGNADRIARHNTLRDAIVSAAQSAALAPRREVSSLIPSSQNCPAVVYLPSSKRGRPAALDVTVISTMQPAPSKGLLSPKVTLFRLARKENWRPRRMPAKLWESSSSL